MKCIGNHRLARFQLVERDRGDHVVPYVVVDFVEDGVVLQDPEFEYGRLTVDEEAFIEEGYEPREYNGIPVFAY